MAMPGWLRRLFGRPAPAHAPIAEAAESAEAPEGDDDPREVLRGYLQNHVSMAFDTRDHILECVQDEVADEGWDVGPDELARMLDEEVARQRAVEADWPERTDCDRLDAAFGELDRAGIIARQHWT